MKPSTLFRIAAALALVQFVAHTSLFLTYAPAHGPDEVAVVAAMKTHYFSFSGSQRSYWDMYFGYGLFSAFNCLLEALLFLFLSSVHSLTRQQTMAVGGIFCFANLVYFALIRAFFFPLPGYFDMALALVMAAAIAVAYRGPKVRAA